MLSSFFLFHISWVAAQFCPLHSVHNTDLYSRSSLTVWCLEHLFFYPQKVIQSRTSLAADLSLSPTKMENGGMNPPSAYHGLEGSSYPFLNTEVCLKWILPVLGTSCRSCLLGGWWEWTPSQYLSVSTYIFTNWCHKWLIKCPECWIEMWLLHHDMSRFM